MRTLVDEVEVSRGLVLIPTWAAPPKELNKFGTSDGAIITDVVRISAKFPDSGSMYTNLNWNIAQIDSDRSQRLHVVTNLTEDGRPELIIGRYKGFHGESRGFHLYESCTTNLNPSQSLGVRYDKADFLFNCALLNARYGLKNPADGLVVRIIPHPILKEGYLVLERPREL